MSIYAKALISHETKVEKLINYEKACLAEFLEYVSEPLTEKVKLDVADLDVCSNIPRVVIAVRKYHAESNVKSSRRIMLHAYLSHAFIKMRTEETIFAYHKRYVESMRKLVDTGFDPLEDDMEAIKLVESLPSEMFGEWQVSLVNREHDAQIAGDAESPWPRTVSEAHTIATSRVSSHTRTKQRYELDMPTISTVNKAVGRGADSQGRGGGTRYTEDGSDDHITRGRTHADKPDEGTKECRVYEGILNHMTKGQRHWQSQCPVLLISTKKKAEVFSELFSIKKNEEDEPEGTKTGSAKSAFSRARWSLQEDEDSDDSGDVPRHMVIMGSAGR